MGFYRKKEKLYMIVFLFSIIVVFSLNYLVANNYNNIPFGLSPNYKKIIMNSKIKSNGFDFFLKYNNIVAIAKTKDNNIIGIYDPQMDYYISSTKFITPGKYRYFSESDYFNKEKVAILIDKINQDTNLSTLEKKTNIIEKKHNFTIVNVFDRNSKISNNSNYNIVVNLFSLDIENITEIYFDNISNNTGLKNDLKNLDCKIIGNDKINSLLSSFKNFFQNRKYPRFISLSLLTSSFALLLFISIYTSSFKDVVDIYRILGLTFKNLITIFLKSIRNIVLKSGFAICLASFYLYKINSFYLDIKSLILLEIFLIVTFIIVGITNIFIVYKNSLKKVR